VLKQRLLTAAVLAPLLLWGILVLPSQTIAFVFAVIMLMGGWEWSALMGIRSPLRRALYIVLLSLAMWVAGWLSSLDEFLRSGLLFLVVVFWVAVLLWIRHYNNLPADRPERPGSKPSRLLMGVLGIVVLAPPWLALVMIHSAEPIGAYLTVYLMCLVWAADSGAYFAGRRWGKVKLAPRVSPGKSWEGVYGGLATASLLALIASLSFSLGWERAVPFILLSVVTVLFSIVGDLFESMIKRMSGVKDSGQLLPGHGGVLDRFDSLTAAAPVFCAGLVLQGMIN